MLVGIPRFIKLCLNISYSYSKSFLYLVGYGQVRRRVGLYRGATVPSSSLMLLEALKSRAKITVP